NPDGLYASIRDQAFYPPLHSLTVAASYILAGEPSLAASRLPSWIAFLLSVFVTAAAIRRTIEHRRDADLSAYAPYGMGIAILFGFFSPLSIQNASVSMLEPLSMLMTAILLYLFARNEDELRAGLNVPVLFGLVLALSILTKYTMVLFVVAPALL